MHHRQSKMEDLTCIVDKLRYEHEIRLAKDSKNIVAGFNILIDVIYNMFSKKSKINY